MNDDHLYNTFKGSNHLLRNEREGWFPAKFIYVFNQSRLQALWRKHQQATGNLVSLKDLKEYKSINYSTSQYICKWKYIPIKSSEQIGMQTAKGLDISRHYLNVLYQECMYCLFRLYQICNYCTITISCLLIGPIAFTHCTRLTNVLHIAAAGYFEGSIIWFENPGISSVSCTNTCQHSAKTETKNINCVHNIRLVTLNVNLSSTALRISRRSVSSAAYWR